MCVPEVRGKREECSAEGAETWKRILHVEKHKKFTHTR